MLVNIKYTGDHFNFLYFCLTETFSVENVYMSFCYNYEGKNLATLTILAIDHNPFPYFFGTAEMTPSNCLINISLRKTSQEHTSYPAAVFKSMTSLSSNFSDLKLLFQRESLGNGNQSFLSPIHT